MAVLPTGNLNLSGVVRYEDQPGRTWKIDREKGRIVGECDNWEAARQAVEITCGRSGSVGKFTPHTLGFSMTD